MEYEPDNDATIKSAVVKLENWNNLRALLDTGAFFPIWTADETILEMLGGIFLRKDITFGGFGGKTKGNLYKLQSMIIGDLILPNTHCRIRRSWCKLNKGLHIL